MDELTQEQIDEESAKIREELTAEVFLDEAPGSTETETSLSESTEAGQAKPEADPWAGVSPMLKESMDKISSRIEGFSEMETRLKQTERRIGAIQNEADAVRRAAGEATAKAAEAPTAEQIAEAEETKEEWKELKEDYPEWAKAIESKLSAQRTEFQESLPNTAKVEGDVASLKTQIDELTTTLQKSQISAQYPEWEDTISTQEYRSWISAQSAEMKVLTTSYAAKDALKVLDAYAGQQAKKTPAEVVAERQRRLRSAASIPNTTAGKQTKSEADQTDDEYRRSASQKIWDED